MTLELFGASVAAVTEFHTAPHGLGEVSGPFPIVVQTTVEAVPSKVRTTCWHAATRCFGASGFMLKVGKKLQAQSSLNWRVGVMGTSGAGVAPGADLVTLQMFWV